MLDRHKHKLLKGYHSKWTCMVVLLFWYIQVQSEYTYAFFHWITSFCWTMQDMESIHILPLSSSHFFYHKFSNSNCSSGTGTFQKLNALNCAFSSSDGELCVVSSSEKSIMLLLGDRNSFSSNSMSGRIGFQKLNSVNSEAIAYNKKLQVCCENNRAKSKTHQVLKMLKLPC